MPDCWSEITSELQRFPPSQSGSPGRNLTPHRQHSVYHRHGSRPPSTPHRRPLHSRIDPVAIWNLSRRVRLVHSHLLSKSTNQHHCIIPKVYIIYIYIYIYTNKIYNINILYILIIQSVHSYRKLTKHCSMLRLFPACYVVVLRQVAYFNFFPLTQNYKHSFAALCYAVHSELQ